MAIAILPPSVHAEDICDFIDTHYKGIYCGIRLWDNAEADEDLVEILSDQFAMDEELIKEILANTICQKITKDYSEDEKAELPQSIKDACLPTGKSTEQVLGSWSLFTDIRNTYEKEKAIQMSSQSLEFKFRASEQYWDGKVGGGPDAPFDLIVDLNLIEIVLFGSKAQWMDDVFAFPPEEGSEDRYEVTVKNKNATTLTISWIKPKNYDGVVDHYRIYYGTKSAVGSDDDFKYEKSIDTLDDKTTFDLGNLITNTTYYIAVTAIDTDGEESDELSNEASGTPTAEVVEGEEEEGFEDLGEPGVSVIEEEEELPPDCVPPDDPEADIGDGPGSDYENPLCGNSTVDLLMAEQCDDGNTKSGDGCNQYCQTEASGSSDQCVDPEAVTFKKPEDGAGLGDGAADVVADIECPPGTVPKKGVAIVGEEAGPPQEVPQDPEYPGPFVGGTLKQFPESTRPPCGPGQSPLQITVAGETHMATDDEGEAICLPFPICADPDIARTFLAAMPPLLIPDGDWKALPDDDPRKEWVDSIEALFCVDLIEHNRPQSPYQMIEGCVDCHITAMVDALEKALETNVTPLQNTTSAFGISSAYGPAFSFNLDTAAKAKLKFKYTDTAIAAIRKAREKAEKSIIDNTKRESTVKNPEESLLQEIGRKAAQIEERRENILEDTRSFKMSNDAISDQEVGGRVIPLLNQMKDSFSNIQSRYEGMITSTAFDEKKQCTK